MPHAHIIYTGSVIDDFLSEKKTENVDKLKFLIRGLILT